MQKEMTFENYFVNTNNSMAVNIAHRIAENNECPQLSYIYGVSGNGKTHLMKAIITAALNESKYESVKYIEAEDLVAEILDSIRKMNTELIIKQYFDVGLLVIDNINIFINKDATANEV